MNILIQSNAPWSHTGYGGPTKSLVRRLDEAGHTISVFCFYGLHGAPILMGNVQMLPPAEDPWGNDVIEAHLAHVGAELLITNMDAWVLHEYGKHGTYWAAWCPVDHKEAPPAVVNALQTCHKPLSYTRHGAQALRDAGLDRAEYMPIGIESDGFYIDPEGREKMRQYLGVEKDEFLIGMVANNRGFPVRKGFDITFESFAELRKKRKVKLYCHTNPLPGPDRPDLSTFLRPLGLTMDDVLWPKTYDYMMGYSTMLMRHLYNAFDVLAVPSVGEGFLIPAVEAHACGKPVIATNCTSLPETTCPDARYMLNKLMPKISVQQAHWFFATPKELTKGLLWAMEHKGDEIMANRARDFAVTNYDWDKLFGTKWLPLLDRIKEEIGQAKCGDIVDQAMAATLPICPE